MREILETAPCQAAQPASVFMAVFATGLRGSRESEACTQGEPPGMPSNAFKESVLLFLLPLPFPLLECQTEYFNRSKHVKINQLIHPLSYVPSQHLKGSISFSLKWEGVRHTLPSPCTWPPPRLMVCKCL